MTIESRQEKLFITGLGGLKDALLPLEKVTLLIGPQASGKSLAAKLLYFCKSFPREMYLSVLDELTQERFYQRQRLRLSEHFGSAVEAGDFRVCYELQGESIEIKAAKAKKGRKPKIEISTSEFFTKEYTSLRRVHGKHARKLEEDDEASVDLAYRAQFSFYNRITKQFSDRMGAQQIFVPAGRSYFSFLQGSIFSLLSNNIPLDPFVKEFGSSYERYKSIALRPRNNAEEGIRAQVEQILKGNYRRERGEDFILTPDGRMVPISSSSSGQQEVLPLLVMLLYFSRGAAIGGRSVYIEEPEAHLFPDTQKQLIELLVYVLSRRRSAQVLLTTHSPYVCATINNLILAGDVVRAAGGVAPSGLKNVTWNAANLDFDDLSVLSFANGNVRSVLDTESRLIDTRYLDSISEQIIHQREALLDLVPDSSHDA